jgi:hypothetical protein
MRPITNWNLRVLLLLALLGLAATAAQAAKVEVCHFPPGNPTNWHTISVSTNALNAHLNHGDLEGNCLENCEAICDDSDACTQDVEPDDTTCLCLAVPTAVDCDDSNPCTADSCDSGVGACLYDTAILDGNACDDSDASTDPDACTGGDCDGEKLYCTSDPDCVYGGTCHSLLGCVGCNVGIFGPLCDTVDAQLCSSDTCLPGQTCVAVITPEGIGVAECQGTPTDPCTGVVCQPLDQCHVAGSCSAGACDNPIALDGTACDDGDPSTSNETCESGVCTDGAFFPD